MTHPSPTSKEEVPRIDRGEYVYNDLSDAEHCRFNIYLKHLGPSLVYATTYTETDAKAICVTMNAAQLATRLPDREVLARWFAKRHGRDDAWHRADWADADDLLALLSSGAATAEQPSSEMRCDKCGGDNPVWFAPNDLWNKVNGSPNGFMRPNCFIKKAEAQGLNAAAWRLEQESVAQSGAATPAPTARTDDSDPYADGAHPCNAGSTVRPRVKSPPQGDGAHE